MRNGDGGAEIAYQGLLDRLPVISPHLTASSPSWTVGDDAEPSRSGSRTRRLSWRRRVPLSPGPGAPSTPLLCSVPVCGHQPLLQTGLSWAAGLPCVGEQQVGYKRVGQGRAGGNTAPRKVCWGTSGPRSHLVSSQSSSRRPEVLSPRDRIPQLSEQTVMSLSYRPLKSRRHILTSTQPHPKEDMNFYQQPPAPPASAPEQTMSPLHWQVGESHPNFLPNNFQQLNLDPQQPEANGGQQRAKVR